MAAVQKQGFPGGGVIQVTGIQANYEAVARCAWIDEWLTASERHDAPSAVNAAKILTASATWPATVVSDGGGMVDHFTALVVAASHGDPVPVAREQKINCARIPAGVTK